MSKKLFCTVCNKSFYALSSTPDAVAFRLHANGSKSEPHRLLRNEHSPIAVSLLSDKSGDGLQPNVPIENDSRGNFEGLEDRRITLVAASENLKSVDLQSHGGVEEGGLEDVSVCSSLSIHSNIYWNALYQSQSCQMQDQIFNALGKGVDIDDEVENFQTMWTYFWNFSKKTYYSYLNYSSRI